MGNSSGKHIFQKTDSKRYSHRKNREVVQTNEILTTHRERKEERIQILEECLTKFEINLNALDQEATRRKEEIEYLLKVLAERKNKDVNDDAVEDKIDENKENETIERIETIMRHCLKVGQSQHNLKDCFKDVRSEFDKCVKTFEESNKHSEEMSHKFAYGQLQTKKKRRKLKDHRSGFHRNAMKIEEQENVQDTPINVQILYTQDGNTMDEIVQELGNVLTRRIGLIDFVHIKDKSELNADMLMIIVCMVSTRVGADAKHAMENIKNPENGALLLVHIGEAHAVSNKNSSLHLTEREFMNLKCIFDMSFKSGNGFFQCDMNEKSINGLTSFCNQETHIKTGYEKE